MSGRSGAQRSSGAYDGYRRLCGEGSNRHREQKSWVCLCFCVWFLSVLSLFLSGFMADV